MKGLCHLLPAIVAVVSLVLATLAADDLVTATCQDSVACADVDTGRYPTWEDAPTSAEEFGHDNPEEICRLPIISLRKWEAGKFWCVLGWMPTTRRDERSRLTKLSRYLCSPERRYDQPFLVTNVTDDWPAMQNFAKREFLRRYPDVVVGMGSSRELGQTGPDDAGDALKKTTIEDYVLNVMHDPEQDKYVFDRKLNIPDGLVEDCQPYPQPLRWFREDPLGVLGRPDVSPPQRGSEHCALREEALDTLRPDQVRREQDPAEAHDEGHKQTHPANDARVDKAVVREGRKDGGDTQARARLCPGSRGDALCPESDRWLGHSSSTGIDCVTGSGTTVPTGVADAVGRALVAASAASCPPSRMRWILFLCRQNENRAVFAVYDVNVHDSTLAQRAVRAVVARRTAAKTSPRIVAKAPPVGVVVRAGKVLTGQAALIEERVARRGADSQLVPRRVLRVEYKPAPLAGHEEIPRSFAIAATAPSGEATERGQGGDGKSLKHQPGFPVTQPVMSAEYAGKRQRGDGDGRRTTVVRHPTEASATSSADLESMLKQALSRIGSLEKQHAQIKMSMERETRALRDDIVSLKGENKAIKMSMERDTKVLRDEIEALKSEKDALRWSLDRLGSKVQEGWGYPVAIQPYEYWQSKGYDDEAIDNLEYGFLEYLKSSVSALEHGVCDSIRVGHVYHDEDLMPHWNALFHSFEHINPHGEGVDLYLHSIELNEEVMRQVCNHIRRNNISQVSFDTVDFTNLRGAISELGNALKSQGLKYLKWSAIPIESVEDMTLFTRVLSQSNSIDHLEFTENGNENARVLLSDVDFSMYKSLDFSDNDLQTNGRTDIPDLIAANTPLEELYLCGNRLNDDDAVLIAQSLGRNTHLGLLNVRRNNIQERGMRALYEAVNDTSTLNALSDSNHSCLLEGLSGDFDLDAINCDSGSNGLHMNRICKIYKLMVERYRNRDGNVPHLNMEIRGEDSVHLAPFVMESVVRRDKLSPEMYLEGFECSLGLLY
ncbi:hypothetical protein THAOC_37829, partial [Thalassiosira oceanica]